jgi:hypothetical protein
MTITTRAERLVKRGRRRAEALMVDECEIRKPSTWGPIDPETGVREEIPGALVYAGKCKVQTYEPFESGPDAGQHRWTIQRYFLHIPTGVTGVDVGHVATITAAPMSDDLLGRKYRISGLHNKTFTTARRLLVDEITG